MVNFAEDKSLLQYLITMLCKNLEKYANILWLQKTILLQLKNANKISEYLLTRIFASAVSGSGQPLGVSGYHKPCWCCGSVHAACSDDCSDACSFDCSFDCSRCLFIASSIDCLVDCLFDSSVNHSGTSRFFIIHCLFSGLLLTPACSLFTPACSFSCLLKIIVYATLSSLFSQLFAIHHRV